MKAAPPQEAKPTEARPSVDQLACRELLREFRAVRRRLRRLSQSDPSRKRVSSYRGVTWSGSNWAAWFYRDGASRYVGSFPTEEEAARAVDAAAIELHGDRARLNFPTVPFAPEGGPDAP